MVKREVVSVSEQCFHVRMADMEKEIKVEVTFLYGLHTIAARASLWKELEGIGRNMEDCWLLMGD